MFLYLWFVHGLKSAVRSVWIARFMFASTQSDHVNRTLKRSCCWPWWNRPFVRIARRTRKNVVSIKRAKWPKNCIRTFKFWPKNAANNYKNRSSTYCTWTRWAKPNQKSSTSLCSRMSFICVNTKRKCWNTRWPEVVTQSCTICWHILALFAMPTLTSWPFWTASWRSSRTRFCSAESPKIASWTKTNWSNTRTCQAWMRWGLNYVTH